ncbi:MAG: gliding motility-associated C-terminal domain-containing protein [Flavobacteriales bacterium]|nr:gliding motility-associated C-terminal domain-containing protein [Flavobacteriales bacterium]
MRLLITLALLFSLSVPSLKAQLCLGDDETICLGQPITISAVCSGGGSPVFLLDSMQQVSLTDDQYSGVINIGFPFTFYGVAYNQLVIASNNYLTFDLTQANGYSPWSISSAAPSSALPMNVVMGPYQDINPGLGGTIEYGTYGTAPNRRFVVRYNQVPMFSCTQDLFCSTMMLYEGTNNIEIYIDNKPLCPTWNSGVAIEGVQNSTGSLAAIVPGRNFPTQWTASADAVQLIPSGGNYNINTISYVPSLLASGIQWWDTDGNFLGTGFEITVTPTNDTTGYYVVYDQCYTIGGGPGNTDTAWVYTDRPDVFAIATDITCVDTVGTATAFATGYQPLFYQWNDPMAQIGPVATNLHAGTYMVMVTDSNGCTNQAVVTVDSLEYTLNTTGITALCFGDSSGSATVSVTPFDTAITYLWDAGTGFQTGDTAFNLPAGTYTVIMTDSLGCQDSATVTVTEPTPLSILDSIIPPTCNGGNNGSITLTVSGGTPNYTYSWGSNQLSGLNAGNYSCVVTDQNGCTDSASFTVTEPQAMTLLLDTQSASCGLSDGAVYAYVQGGTPSYSYVWTPGGAGNDSLMNVGTGMYSLTVTDSNGCTVTDSAFVDEYKDFYVDFSLTPDQGITPLQVAFSNYSTNCTTYYWDFGNGNTSFNAFPADETYTQEGTYQVMLIGCNSSGLDRCCDTVIKTVLVEHHSACSWSNVFTPNGDNFNDEFVIDCDKIVDFYIQIYNRWGEEVFESNDINISWDGKKGGREVPDGTYFFLIRAKGIDDIEWNHQGYVSLIR